MYLWTKMIFSLQCMELIIVRSPWGAESNKQYTLALITPPPSTSDFYKALLPPVMVQILYVRDLHAVVWGPSNKLLVVGTIKTIGQWLLLSWLSSPFQHQRSAVQIQSSAKFTLNIVYCQLFWKDENKEKRGREWPIF